MISNDDKNEITARVQDEFDTILRDLKIDVAQNSVIKSNDELEKMCQLLIKIRQNPEDYLHNVDTLIFDHNIFICIRDTVVNVMNKLNDESEVSEKEEEFFNESSYVLSKIANIPDVSNIFKKLFVQTEFIKSIQRCINDIAANGTHINDYNIIFGITCILEAFIAFRNKTEDHDDEALLSLLDSTIKCICSDYYLESFQEVEVNATELHNGQYLFLYACPYYILEYNGVHRQEKVYQLSEKIFTYLEKLFKKFPFSTIKQPDVVLLQAFTRLLSILIMLPVENFNNHLSLIDQFISIIKITEQFLIDITNRINSKNEFIYSTMMLIYNLAAEHNLREYIKKKHKDVIAVFEKLSSIKTIEDKRIQSIVNILFFLLLDNDQYDRIKDTRRLTNILVSYLVSSEMASSKAHYGISLEQLLVTTKVLLQESAIQESFVKEDQGLPILIKCSTEPDYDDMTVKLPSLQSLWILAFLNKAATQLKSDPNLINFLKSILMMDAPKSKQLREVADGIFWKLEKEPKRLQDQNISQAEKVTYEFDAMISYTHHDKQICRKIFEELKKRNFNVWIDQEQMFGSTMERMAEGVEKSPFLIICMSNNYAKSQACQAEATYAKGQNRGLILIKLEKEFKPRGWLAILMADSFYVNFGKQSFDIAVQELLEQINRHRKSKKHVSKTDLEIPNPPASRTNLSVSTTDRQTSPHPCYSNVGTSMERPVTSERGTELCFESQHRTTSPRKFAPTDRGTSAVSMRDASVCTDSIATNDGHTSPKCNCDLQVQSKNSSSKICTLS